MTAPFHIFLKQAPEKEMVQTHHVSRGVVIRDGSVLEVPADRGSMAENGSG